MANFIDNTTLDWLLDPNDPALLAKVLTDLLGRSPDNPEVVDARSRIPEQPFAKAALDAITSGRIWEHTFYIKYRGISWTMAHLSEIGVPGDHPAIQTGIENILETPKRATQVQQRDVAPLKGCQPVYWKHPLACLTARMATVLTRYGLTDHEVTRGARATLLHLHQPGLGFACQVIDYSLLPGCIMTVPEVLKCWLSIPAQERTPEEETAIRESVELLRKHGLYKYVPVAAKEFAEKTYKWKVADIRELKDQWIANGRLNDRKAKDGWLRFSFPHTYNPDLLELLLVLGEARRQFGEDMVPQDELINEALQLVLDRRGKDGRWKLTGGINGKMWANLDQKGKPSPWITYRAHRALRLLDPAPA
ncbi:hypothetical protein KQI52_01550 [bacterium]|nr:hypothetical protein [bacterium]